MQSPLLSVRRVDQRFDHLRDMIRSSSSGGRQAQVQARWLVCQGRGLVGSVLEDLSSLANQSGTVVWDPAAITAIAASASVSASAGGGGVVVVGVARWSWVSGQWGGTLVGYWGGIARAKFLAVGADYGPGGRHELGLESF